MLCSANRACDWASKFMLTFTNGALLSRARLGRHFLCPLSRFIKARSQNWPIEQIFPFSQSVSHLQKVTHHEAAQSLARNETREKRKTKNNSILEISQREKERKSWILNFFIEQISRSFDICVESRPKLDISRIPKSKLWKDWKFRTYQKRIQIVKCSVSWPVQSALLAVPFLLTLKRLSISQTSVSSIFRKFNHCWILAWNLCLDVVYMSHITIESTNDSVFYLWHNFQAFLN